MANTALIEDDEDGEDADGGTQGRQVEMLRLKNGDDQHCAQVIHDGEGGEEDDKVGRDAPREENQNAHSESNVGRGGNPPTPCRWSLGIQSVVEQGRQEHTAYGRYRRKQRVPKRCQFPDQDFTFELQSHQQEEECHQPFIDPGMQAEFQWPGANSDMQRLLPKMPGIPPHGELAKRIKFYVTCTALGARKRLKEVFQQGTCLPLRTGGEFKNHVVAFARRYRKSWAIVVTPRFLTRLVKPSEVLIGECVWHDTHLLVRQGMPQSWVNLLTGEMLHTSAKLLLGDVLGDIPVALLLESHAQAETSPLL